MEATSSKDKFLSTLQKGNIIPSNNKKIQLKHLFVKSYKIQDGPIADFISGTIKALKPLLGEFK